MSLAELVVSSEDEGKGVRYIQFHIYFSKFTTTTYKQMPAITLSSLVGSIGGSMGIFLGASVITCIELVAFLFTLLQRCLAKVCGRAVDLSPTT